jgi:hypothetical protein
MARLVATNFTGGLQFPYATAAADLFHKEDVQTLALAVDQHDHTTGKGVGLSAGSIPTGLITSAMIQNGTIVAADIAANTIGSGQIAVNGVLTANLALNAVTQPSSLQAFGAFAGSSISTTSTTYVNCAGLVLTVTCNGGNLLTVVTGALGSSSAASITIVGLKNDGAGPSLTTRLAPLVANTATPFVLFGFWGPLSGSHTFQLAWQTSAGTATMDTGTSFTMYAVEFLR